ncbi:MAG: sulfite exporter TauE/SafE family protein [Burkholderiales bacterium]|nr:sulfite exporter TauE/SafE family protein [Nitrosomonas sp.]MCP5274500.1 sulfite exporter TauE/SafE family protein [Burkholderiales bacterium]
MDYFIVCLAALAASALTLFSGFGLGTLLMPVTALFFPIETAIAMTAMVHLANNLFKIGLLGKYANRQVLLHFGLPAIITALAGATLMTWLSDIPPIYEYQAFGSESQISPIKLVIGLLIIFFVTIEFSPRISKIALDRKYLPVGGMISGFFGGLSGHQGAFRSMFLLKAGLSKETFIATGVVIAVMVDLSRMVIYGLNISTQQINIEWTLIAAAMLSAFTGAYFSAKLLKKVTIRFVQVIVSILLVIVSFGLISGLL